MSRVQFFTINWISIPSPLETIFAPLNLQDCINCDNLNLLFHEFCNSCGESTTTENFDLKRQKTLNDLKAGKRLPLDALRFLAKTEYQEPFAINK